MLRYRYVFGLATLLLILTIAFLSQSATAQQCFVCHRHEYCTEGYAWNQDTCECEPSSPIIIDTDGAGFHLTSAAGGVFFDLNTDGKKEKIAWTQASSTNAFLALDRNHNGTIDDGTELFGNFTPQPASGNKNGFLALAEYDRPERGGNGDGIIDQNDEIFPELLVWRDSNHNGISEPNELLSLRSVGIESIFLGYRESSRTDEFGNVFRFRSKVQGGTNDGLGRWAYDVLLQLAHAN